MLLVLYLISARIIVHRDRLLQDQCSPNAYVSMNDASFVEELKHFKAKSKSWSGPPGVNGNGTPIDYMCVCMCT